jgi:hypothetical protein
MNIRLCNVVSVAMRIALVVCVFAFGIACGDKDKSPTVLTGTFVDSPVSQLHYATATQSGLTDEQGTFKYLAGETVTFAVGGVTLGSAPGADQVTPFSLYNSTPPSTQAEVVVALGDYQTTTDLERVGNITAFLVALDVDRNPDNGIDLTGMDAALAGSSLSFDAEMRTFAFYRLIPFLRAHGVGNINALPWTGLSHLYATLGIAVPVHQSSKASTDSDGNGTIDTVSTYEYDALGNPTKTSRDDGNNGSIDSVYTSTYNTDGTLATTLDEKQPVGDGTFHSRTLTTYSYSAPGEQSGRTTETRVNGVLKSTNTRTSVLDAFGSLVSDHTVIDADGNGTADATHTNTYAYGADGQQTTEVDDTDSNADGAADDRSTTTSVYDANGNQLSQVTEQDDGADGSIESRARYVYTYDTNNHRLSQTSTTEDGAGHVLSTRVYTYTYDASGHRTSLAETDDNDGNGTIEKRNTTTYTYDAAGRQVGASQDTDTDGNGTTDTRVVWASTYDANGNNTTYGYTTDTGADGTINQRSTFTYSYDADGDLLTSALAVDSNGDGTTDSSTQSTYEYVAIANGLTRLVSGYGFD